MQLPYELEAGERLFKELGRLQLNMGWVFGSPTRLDYIFLHAPAGVHYDIEIFVLDVFTPGYESNGKD